MREPLGCRPSIVAVGEYHPQLIRTYLTRFSFSSARNALQECGVRSKSMTLSEGQRAFGGRKFVPGVVAALAWP